MIRAKRSSNNRVTYTIITVLHSKFLVIQKLI